MTGCPLPIIRKLIFCRKPGKQELNNVLCFRPAIAAKSIFAPEEIAQPLGVIRTLYEEMFPGVDFSEYLKQREKWMPFPICSGDCGTGVHGAGRGPDFRTGQGCI